MVRQAADGGRRLVFVATTGRADYGLLKPVVEALQAERGLRVRWLVTGAHFQARLGRTIREIRHDGFGSIVEAVPLGVDGDRPADIAQAIGRGVARVARLFQTKRPDVLVVLGDRFETLAVVSAALPFNIPVAHVHGGERTEGLIDEAIRHAITKMSHLHFVSNRDHARRVRQLGEEAWRVTVSGAPGLDRIHGFRAIPAEALAARLGVPVHRRTLLVTYHPETLDPDRAVPDLRKLLTALDRLRVPVVFTSPNADTGGRGLQAAMNTAVASAPDRVIVHSLGQQDYLSLMTHAGAMVGNSSSGIIEAPSFRLPVVNIGDRQQGRTRARNVIDVPADARRIEHAIRRALAPAFRQSLRGLRNPYGSGSASRRIAERVAAIPLDRRLLVKRFTDR